VVVGVHWGLAPQWCAGDLAAAVGNNFVYVHVELDAAARHPYMQREHVMMLTAEDFVANLNDQIVALLVEALASIMRIGGGFLQDGIGSNHFPGNQILPYVEVLKRALGLCSPEFVGRNIHFAEAIGFLAKFCHIRSPLGRQIRRKYGWTRLSMPQKVAASGKPVYSQVGKLARGLVTSIKAYDTSAETQLAVVTAVRDVEARR
jgi:hypothetical protein